MVEIRLSNSSYLSFGITKMAKIKQGDVKNKLLPFVCPLLHMHICSHLLLQKNIRTHKKVKSKNAVKMAVIGILPRDVGDNKRIVSYDADFS